MTRFEIELTPEAHAPFESEPFKVVIRAAVLDEARGKAYRLLKRTYGDGTPKGNPMYWRITKQQET